MSKKINSKKIKKLREIVEYEGTEWGEFVGLLLAIRQYSLGADEFEEALDNELQRNYKYYVENYSLEVKEETIKVKNYELVHKS